jgi:2,3-bisphosphoglycerate-dependent phosphoglycerate mutase
MKIFLVRHGESLANIHPTIYQKTADFGVPLSGRGLEQAAVAGTKLAEYFLEDHVRSPIRLWTSPYRRTRETAHQIVQYCRDDITDVSLITDCREHINLCEQQFGLFDGIPEEELPQRFPAEHALYRKCEEHGGRFWARMPLGESRFDVAVRVHQAFGTFQRDAEKHGIENIVVVCHGVTMRAFIMQWLHLTPEWFDAEKNPKNCAIRLIDGNEDCGYIHEGG